jgi:predicted DCC family thiol-disulfide oxidoreductase YuxK
MPGFPFSNHGIILFDGVCNYCSRWVDFIIRNDKKDYFRFATLQSEAAQRLLNKEINSSRYYSDSVIFIENGMLFFKSDAGLRILKKLGFPFSLAYSFIVIPKFIRTAVYNFIANNRYKWFGKKEICRIPFTEEEKRKFLH